MEVFATMLIAKMVGERDEDKRREYLDHAEPILRKLLEVEPENMRGILYMGYAQQGYEKWDKAIALYEKYQRKYPDDPDTYRRLAGIYLVTNRDQQALHLLEKVFTMVDDEARVARQIGEIYAGRGDWARACEWYNRAVEIDAYDYEIHSLWGKSLIQLKDWPKARREFEAATKLKPIEPDGWLGLAEVASMEGDAGKAAEYKKKADEAGSTTEEPK
jgi:tetratricopeptide (TPR) repeat protein